MCVATVSFASQLSCRLPQRSGWRGGWRRPRRCRPVAYIAACSCALEGVPALSECLLPVSPQAQQLAGPVEEAKALQAHLVALEAQLARVSLRRQDSKVHAFCKPKPYVQSWSGCHNLHVDAYAWQSVACGYLHACLVTTAACRHAKTTKLLRVQQFRRLCRLSRLIRPGWLSSRSNLLQYLPRRSRGWRSRRRRRRRRSR